MKQVLLVIPSEDLRIGLEELLQRKFHVTSCTNGVTALQILKTQHTDILVLDLELADLDGLCFLAAAGCDLPKHVLALSTVSTNYIHQTAHDLGVDLLLLKPCSIRSILQHVHGLSRMEYSKTEIEHDPQTITSRYLTELGIPQNLAGFKQLKVGIPLYAQDSDQKETKELFPNISKLIGQYTPTQIERSIRVAIQAGTKRGDPKVWRKYFPVDDNGTIKPPTSKQFIACLAEKLLEEWYYKRPA